MVKMNMMSAVNENQAMPLHPVAEFLREFSMEITPKHLDKIDVLAAHLKPGTPVYVAMIEAGDQPGILKTVSALRRAGLEPVPHVPARFVLTAFKLPAYHRHAQFATTEAIDVQ